MYFICFGAGCVSGFSFPPYHYSALALVSVALLFIYSEKLKDKNVRPSRSFWLGWCFGFGHFVVSLYWIANALYVDISSFFWLIPFAVIGIPIFLAIYIGIVTWICHFFHCKYFYSLILFSTIWTILELFRSYLFTGFPWNLISSIWADNIYILQSLAYIGPYGLGWLTIFMSGLIAGVFLCTKYQYRILSMLLFVFIFYALQMFGEKRLENNTQSFHNVNIKVVQPNLPQTLKWQRGAYRKNLQMMIDLSQEEEGENNKRTFVIWPETAVTSYLNQDDILRAHISSVLRDGDLLATGALAKEFLEKDHIKRWNSLYVIDQYGHILSRYDKHHLVPFGEYIPFKNWLSFIPLVTQGTNFSVGGGVQTINVGWPSFSPMICYEVVFSGHVASMGSRPEWLLNITNDAWFGHSPGPYQHFAMARFRAIEEGLPLVRAANTGISALIDPYGRIVDVIELENKGSFVSPLPLRIQTLTFYSANKRFFILLFFFIFSIYIVSYYKFKH